MSFIRTLLLGASIMGTGVAGVSAWAQQGGPGMGPPPEARQACVGKSQDAPCRFVTPRGQMSGICGMPPRQAGTLLCMPRGGGPGGSPGGAPGGSPQTMRPHGADIAAKFAGAKTVSSRVPDTQQGSCFSTTAKIACPGKGQALYGQDAHYHGPAPSYTDNADGTVRDAVTGLLWEKAHHAKRLGYGEAKAACQRLTIGGRTDWRLPTIKELFSLADFRGSQRRRFFIDDVFDLAEPDASVLQGDRFAATHSTQMMGQTWSSTLYTGVHYGRPGVEAAFFYNFLDGHIKQAPTHGPTGLFYRCVSGPEWGANDFVDNGDGTVTDRALGLTWQQSDDGQSRDWPQALRYCENLALAGHDDWRLPNVKELQSIVDYTKNDPALDQRYLRQSDKGAWFWSSTTHGDNISMASYVCFGKCVSSSGIDTHGAGAQRSDPKTGDPSRWTSLGGQKDAVRIYNAVRCVR
ncbi:DUF1566 domain-containing protein [Magnetovibrio sp.]|uniref:Lcl C-terminal domain-containing protein n=1 Tax=Magnetovibrio sp. TaxID=2024836 RepID=UPI002F9469BD